MSALKFHWISPYDPASPPNIGKAINDAIRQLNADGEDWVIHNDQDVLYLLPDTKKHMVEILSRTDYDLLGCMTNRLRSKEQLFYGEFMQGDGILKHMDLAKVAWSDHGDTVKPVTGVLAAFCLCFRVRTWKALGGFPEGALTFDSVFSARARRMGMVLGVMSGIYLWHSYRLGSERPFNDIKHLYGNN